MSAPAMKQPGLPERRTADLAELSLANFWKASCSSALVSSLREFTLDSAWSNLEMDYNNRLKIICLSHLMMETPSCTE